MKASERHKLKEDKAAETMAVAWQWAGMHQSTLIAGACAALVIVAVIIWAVVSRQSAEEGAGKLFSEVSESAAKVMSADAKDKVSMAKDVVKQCDRIAKDYSGTVTAPRALLLAATCLSDAGQWPEATGYYERAIDATGGNSGLARLARHGLADALAQSGKTKEAIAQYTQLLNPDRPQEDLQTNWDLGRCYMTLGDKDNATKHFQKVVDAGGDSKWAALARGALMAMTSKATLPPISLVPGLTPAATVPTTLPGGVPAAPSAPMILPPKEEKPATPPAEPPKAPAPAVAPPAAPSVPAVPAPGAAPEAKPDAAPATPAPAAK